MNPPVNCIEIRKLRVSTCVGVPDEELATAQVLEISIIMTPLASFEDLSDDILQTVDYAAVALEIQAIADQSPRRLIETLAADIAKSLLNKHPLRSIEVLIEKFILPNTECVAVRVVRDAIVLKRLPASAPAGRQISRVTRLPGPAETDDSLR
jgi:7,8-dihydroneopterin aldolase/epimerase/oxygenase